MATIIAAAAATTTVVVVTLIIKLIIAILLLSFVSPHEGLTLAAILNNPEKLLEGEGSSHVICIFQNIPCRLQAFKSHGQGADPGPSQGHTRTSPTPSRVYRGEAEAATSVEYSEQRTIPPPIQHWKNSQRGRFPPRGKALLEAALAPGMPTYLYPPYPCIEHISLPSPSAASFNLLSVTPGVRGRFRTVTTSGRLGRFSSITFFSFFFLAVITLMIVLCYYLFFFRFDYVLVVNC